MFSITGLNIFPSAKLPKAKEAEAIEAQLQSFNVSEASNGSR